MCSEDEKECLFHIIDGMPKVMQVAKQVAKSILQSSKKNAHWL